MIAQFACGHVDTEAFKGNAGSVQRVERLGVKCADPRSLVHVGLYKALLLEHSEGFPQRGSADGQYPGQLRLLHDSTWGEGARHYKTAQVGVQADAYLARVADDGHRTPGEQRIYSHGQMISQGVLTMPPWDRLSARGNWKSRGDAIRLRTIDCVYSLDLFWMESRAFHDMELKFHQVTQLGVRVDPEAPTSSSDATICKAPNMSSKTDTPSAPSAAQVLAAHPRADSTLAARSAASTDRSGYQPATLPETVVLCETVDDVVQAFVLAHEHGLPVVPRGAGTGLAGGASAHGGEVVVDLSRMNRILSIDPVEMIAVVEPGVLNAEVNAAAAKYGLFYAPDPASTAICSIGGNIATNAGGMWCAKYGVTRESVLGLVVVLADGRLLRTGRKTLKGVTGYDLNALFIGSEGTLGTVVEATLRLRPKPARTETLAAYFRDIEAAGRAASAITAARIQPSILELMDGPTMEAVDMAEGTGHRKRGGAFLLAQTDGYGAHLELEEIAKAIGPFAISVSRASDAAEAEALVKARRDAIPSLEKLGRVSIGDIAVPRNRLAEAFTGLEDIASRRGVNIYSVAHAADGNLHPMIVVDPEVSITEGPAKAALSDMFRLAQRLGGTLTGEHGVGTLKREWVADELGDLSIELHRGIKASFDPQGILNPGKAF